MMRKRFSACALSGWRGSWDFPCLEEIRELLELRIVQPEPEMCRWVQQRVEEKLTVVRQKLEQLQRLEGALMALLRACQRRQVTDPCPLLAALGQCSKCPTSKEEVS